MDRRLFIALLVIVHGVFASGCLIDASIQTSLVDMILDPPGPLTTYKSGGSAAFELWLRGVALGSATVEIQSSDTALGQPVPQTLFFAQSEWTKPQSVAVIGRDDGVVGDENYRMTFSLKGTSFIVDYTQTSDQPLDLVAVDNVAAILTSQQAGITSATVDVMLRLIPTDAVTVTLATAAPSTVDPNHITFTPDDAHTAQTVTVSHSAGTQPLLTLTGTSIDPHYNNLVSQIQIGASP